MTTADKYWDDSQVIVLNTNGGTVKSNSTPDAKTGLYIPEKQATPLPAGMKMLILPVKQ